MLIFYYYDYFLRHCEIALHINKNRVLAAGEIKMELMSYAILVN